jgi:hypothetical protein
MGQVFDLSLFHWIWLVIKTLASYQELRNETFVPCCVRHVCWRITVRLCIHRMTSQEIGSVLPHFLISDRHYDLFHLFVLNHPLHLSATSTYVFECHFCFIFLTLILLIWRIWWAPNNASKGQIGFNSVFKGLRSSLILAQRHHVPTFFHYLSSVLSDILW